MNRDGTDKTDLGPGCVPSLSADGQHVVFSDPREGIVRMKSDGSERETIEQETGWGAQWSPDGRQFRGAAGHALLFWRSIQIDAAIC
ncbi:MAG: hypothetical protein U0936_26545 [Planctomycetaceae bacterium]